MFFKNNISLTVLILFFTAALSFQSCENNPQQAGSIRGTVDTAADTIAVEKFLIVSRTDDISLLENDPMNQIVTIYTLNSDGSFNIPLHDYGIKPGEKIYLIAIGDNDRGNGIPYPAPGDFMGFYIDKNLNTAINVTEKNISNLNITINREVFDFNAWISGTVNGPDTGSIIIIAYTGEITSMNFRPENIHADDIAGFKKIDLTKTHSYTMKIMPYGKNLPLGKVTVLGILDNNRNGIPDAGDTVGYYTGQSPDNLPGQISISQNGHVENITISMAMTIPEPSAQKNLITIKPAEPDAYRAPENLQPDGKPYPLFVIIADTDDPAKLFTSPAEVIRDFVKIPLNADGSIQENGVTIDLSTCGLSHDLINPENSDSIMLVVLWDRDYNGSFPIPTPGDYAGFYMNKDPDNYSFTMKLANTKRYASHGVAPDGTANSDYTFNADRIIYEHKTSFTFILDDTDPDGNKISGLTQGDQLIAVAVHKDAVNNSGKITDLNGVLGMQRLVYNGPETYSFSLYDAIHKRYDTSEPMEVYIVLIYDRNRDGKPTQGEDDIAAYWKTVWLFGTKWIPKTFSMQTGNDYTLSNPDTVKFLGKKYGENLIF